MWIWELDHKEGWAPKNWCFQTVVLEKTPESPSDCREMKPVYSKGDQPWIFIGRTATEAKAPILWPPDSKSLLNGKDPDAGKDWEQEEKGVTEDEMIRQHHWLNGQESEQTRGQRSLVCCAQSMGLQRLGHDSATEQHCFRLRRTNSEKWNLLGLRRHPPAILLPRLCALKPTGMYGESTVSPSHPGTSN